MVNPLRVLTVGACVVAGAIVACVTSPASTAPASTAPAATPGSSTTTAAPPGRAPRDATLHVLLSADEHGWIQPTKDKAAGLLRGGVYAAATTMAGEGFARGQPGWLLLSAGDMWTGPYETTVLEGAPMAAAMRELGYAAAAVGNHEFDFGQRAIAERRRESPFPFLAANLVESSTGQQPPWAQAYTIVDVPQDDGGVARVGVVGLACVESPSTSDVRHMVGLEFQPYDHALEHWVPLVQAEHPDVVVVVAHDSIARVEPLVPLLRRHGIHLLAAGHEHRAGLVVDDNHTADASDDVVICNAGPYLRSLCRVDLTYDDGVLRAHAEKHVAIATPLDQPVAAPNEALKAIVDDAEASATRIGGEVLVDSPQRLERGREGALGKLVVDSWLEGLPYAQAAITNAGGLRQDIDAGPLRLRDIVSALPFNNYLLVVDMTGAELREVLGNPESVVGGLTYAWHDEAQGTRIVTSLADAQGRPIADTTKLKVIINDFMYRGGDHYRFADREPEETAVDWREPIFRVLRGRKARGLPLVVDPAPRARRE